MSDTIKKNEERDLFIHNVSNQDKVYTFQTVGILTINGEEVNTYDITLTPQEVMSIRKWFWERGLKWISYVPHSFRDFNPQLYDKLYQTLVDYCNQSGPLEDWEIDLMDDDYDPDYEIEYDPDIVPEDYNMGESGPWDPLLWPKQLFQEMSILIPNIQLWVAQDGQHKEWGVGYPLYIEEKYLGTLREILETWIWSSRMTGFIDIERLSEKYPELYAALKKSIDEWFIEFNIDINEKTSINLFQLTLEQ